MSGAPCSMRARIDAHFAGAIRPADERAMREHLPSCAECKGHYERHLLLARLDPAALGSKERLARGLGIRQRRAPSTWAMGLAAFAATAVALLLFAGPQVRDRAEDSDFVPRGGSEIELPSTSLAVFRLEAGEPKPVNDRIQAGDELAFAYENPEGRSGLLVFGVDEHRHVYWFYPAWRDPQADPTAVAIERTEAPRELPEGVRHSFDGEKLTIHAVFTDEPLTVREVERRLSSGRAISESGEERTLELEVGR